MNDCYEKPIWEYEVTEGSESFVPKNENPQNIVVAKYALRKNKLIPISKKTLKGKKAIGINDNISGEFYVVSGYIEAVSYATSNSFDIVVSGIEDEKTATFKFTVNKKDTCFDKLDCLKNGDRITVLMCNKYCVDLKFGPIHGHIPFKFRDEENTFKVIEYRVY